MEQRWHNAGVTSPGGSTSILTRGQPPARPIVIIVIAISVASLVAGWVGDALAPDLVNRNPLLLIAMSPRNRNLILTTNSIETVPYYLVGTLRLVLSDPANYLIGFWFGDRMLAWIKRRSKTYGPMVDSGADGFKRYAPVVIFAFPNNIICMLSGATGVRFRLFALLNVTGTVVQLYLVRRAGDAFQSPIQRVLDWIGQYRIPLLVVSVLAVAWTVFGEFRGDNSELSTLRDLANDDPTESSVDDGEVEGEDDGDATSRD